MDKIKIILDASNLLDGGGLSHLREFTYAFSTLDSENVDFIVVGNKKALSVTAEASNIKKVHHPFLEKNILFRTYFRKFLLHKIVSQFDIVFDPGGGYYSSIIPYVTMSRNMLVFEKTEAERYGFSWKRVRLWILNKLQIKSICGAKGIIFISNYAKNFITKLPNIKISRSTIIHHGATELFFNVPKIQQPLENYSFQNPFNILYVSIIDVYKHHEELIDAVVYLRKLYPIEITFVGGAYLPSYKSLKDKLITIPDGNNFIHYVGKKNIFELQEIYHSMDMFVFSSSCENMPNILIEAMSSGLPIASSDRGPMPEFLKDAGVYFDPENVFSIIGALEKMILDKDLRASYAKKSNQYAKEYSWKNCTVETIRFLIDCLKYSGK